MVELVGHDERFATDKSIVGHWGNIPRAMWTLMRLMTFDDWAVVFEEVISRKPEVLCVFVPFFCIANLALMNLVVGVMFDSAMIVVSQDEKYDGLRKNINAYLGVIELRAKLKSLEEDNYHWTLEEILDAVKKDRALSYRFKKGGVTLAQLSWVWDAAESFDPRGWMLGDDFIEACMGLNMDLKERFFDLLELEASLRSLHKQIIDVETHVKKVVVYLHWVIVNTHPWQDSEHQKTKRELLGLLARVVSSMTTAGHKVNWVGDSGKGTDDHMPGNGNSASENGQAELVDIMDEDEIKDGEVALANLGVEDNHQAEALTAAVDAKVEAPSDDPLLVPNNNENSEKAPQPSKGSVPGGAKKSVGSLAVALHDEEDDEEAEVKEEHAEDMATRTFARFDSFYGFFLLANCVLIGVQVDDPLADSTHLLFWWAQDMVFTSIFTIELVQRIFLSYQDRKSVV